MRTLIPVFWSIATHGPECGRYPESKYKAALVITSEDTPEDGHVELIEFDARSDEAAKLYIQQTIGPGDDRLILRRKEVRQLVVENGTV